MNEYLASLKRKPKAVRERIAVGTSLGVTSVVTLAWLMVLMFASPYDAPAEGSDEFARSISDTHSSLTDVLAGVGAADDTTRTAGGVEIVDTTPDTPKDETPAAIAF